MIDKLTKDFFDAFGIEPKLKYYCPSCNTELEKCLDSEGIYYRCGNHLECDYFLDVQSEDFEECLNCLSFKLAHPQITSDILLELICVLNTVTTPDLGDINIDRLKKTILEECIRALTTIETPTIEDFINDIRTLFKEG